MNVIHEDVRAANLVVRINAVGMNYRDGNRGLGPFYLRVSISMTSQYVARAYLLEELHARDFNIESAGHIEDFAVAEHGAELWESHPGNPAGAVGEVNVANHVEVADGKLLAEGARDSIVER